MICRRGAYEVLKLQQEGVPTDGTAKKGGSSFDFLHLGLLGLTRQLSDETGEIKRKAINKL